MKPSVWVAALQLMFALMAAAPAQAISEKDFAADYARLVMPYYAAGVAGTFAGRRGVPIAYRVFDRGVGSPAIVILPGRTEPFRRYAELVYDLGTRGYSVFVMDHRGQGASGRLTPLHDLSHVDDFEDYVDDLATFVDRVVTPRRHGKLFVLAHSMGGAVAALYLARHPRVFAAAVLVSPMFSLNLHGTNMAFAFYASLWKVLTGSAAYPVDGMDGYRYNPNLTLEQAKVTSSPARFAVFGQSVREDPNLACGGISYGWLHAAFIADDEIEAFGARGITTPVTIFKAGKDILVNTGAFDAYCAPRRALCTVVSEPFREAFHEILQERDEIRDKALDLIVAWFQ
jgi:lysophospholipase